MKNDPLTSILLMIFALILLAIGWTFGGSHSRRQCESLMVSSKYGEYAIDQSDGKVRFRMFTEAEIIGKYLSGSSIAPRSHEYKFIR